MDEKLTPEEVSAITGEDIEDVRSAQHPEQATALEPEEGDAPNIEGASWDDEIEKEDKSDIHFEDVNFKELAPSDRDLYLQMTALRKEIREGASGADASQKVRELALKVREEHQKGLSNKSREYFLAFLNNKIQVLMFELWP